MKRFVTTAAMAAASCALVVSGSGIASADGHHGRGGHNRYGHDNGRFGNDGFGRGGFGRGGFGRGGYRGFYGHRGGANAAGFAAGSPGILSGNVVQVPINIPINVCGNSLNVAALLNPAFGNVCINR
ncbi:chaplin [Streptomyces sp. NPDC020742]|uniref:chaplin n=1 Tax=unclassified Streptomyces TaxID=2593676 RepID=UPI0033C2342A